MHKAISTIMAGLLFSACMARGTASYSVTAPRLLYVSAGVQVIEDHDEPIFYSSDRYWRYDGGVWYSSRYHTRDWVRIATPPAAIVRIERPAAYVHFKGSARVEQKAEQREIREERREDKAEQKAEQREIREERREDKAEQKAEKAEQKAEQKAEKKDSRDHAGHPGGDDHGKPGKGGKR